MEQRKHIIAGVFGFGLLCLLFLPNLRIDLSDYFSGDSSSVSVSFNEARKGAALANSEWPIYHSLVGVIGAILAVMLINPDSSKKKSTIVALLGAVGLLYPYLIFVSSGGGIGTFHIGLFLFTLCCAVGISMAISASEEEENISILSTSQTWSASPFGSQTALATQLVVHSPTALLTNPAQSAPSSGTLIPDQSLEILSRETWARGDRWVWVRVSTGQHVGQTGFVDRRNVQ